jgi:hypothetical protein
MVVSSTCRKVNKNPVFFGKIQRAGASTPGIATKYPNIYSVSQERSFFDLFIRRSSMEAIGSHRHPEL